MWHPEPAVRHAIPETHWPSQEEAARSLLFQPIQINHLTLQGRTWVPAMVPWRATEDGFVTPENLDWYGRFAEGQPGAIVVEATGGRDIPSGPLLRIGHDRFIPGLRKLVETVRRTSCGKTRLFIQIIDFLTVKRRPEKAKFFERFFQVKAHHTLSLAELTEDESWLNADAERVRAFLMNAPEDALDKILDERELESLRYGYRERVTDVELAHIRELPHVLPEIFASAGARARRADAKISGMTCGSSRMCASSTSVTRSR